MSDRKFKSLQAEKSRLKEEGGVFCKLKNKILHK